MPRTVSDHVVVPKNWPHSGLRRSSRRVVASNEDDDEITLHDDDDDSDFSDREQDACSTRSSTVVKRGVRPRALKLRVGWSCKSPTSKSKLESITIKGVKLQPSVVFDTFWYFAAERKAVDDRRRAGLPEPWTEDPILQKYSFCNTFRVLDKTCQYIISEVIEKGSQDPTELVFRIVLFNLFTRIETWELLTEELGPLTWAGYKREDYGRVLTRAKRSGLSLYTGSFQKPFPHFGHTDAHMNHLSLLEVFMENDLAGRLRKAKYLVEVYEYLISFPSMGEFSTFQLILNLSYSKVLKFSNLDFVVPGLGAVSGLDKIFGKAQMHKAKIAAPGIEEEIIRWLVKNQDQQFLRLGLKFSGLGPDRLPMDLADIEHLLCEVDKYSRQKHPQFKGKRTEMKRKFTAATHPYPSQPVIPAAWSHPDRQVVRVRSTPAVVEKRYQIHKLGAHRRGGNGLEFKVYWQGYPDSDATWEPVDSLISDAPIVVSEYMKKHGLKA